MPGRRLKLHSDDLYAYVAPTAAGIDERMVRVPPPPLPTRGRLG